MAHLKIVEIKNRHNRVYRVQPHHCVDRAFGGGIYQVNSLRRLYQLQPHARRIIDVGANVGTNTIEYSTWAQAVEAFEPNDVTFELLQHNVAANQSRPATVPWLPGHNMRMQAAIHLHHAAVMHEPGQAQLFHREAGLADFVRPGATAGDQVCDQVSIDSYGWTDVDIIKADTEGTEWLIVQGAQRTIEQCRPVVQVEMWGWERRLGLDNQQMLDYFRDLDYVHQNNAGDHLPWDAAGRWNKAAAQAAGHRNSAMDRFFVPRELL